MLSSHLWPEKAVTPKLVELVIQTEQASCEIPHFYLALSAGVSMDDMQMENLTQEEVKRVGNMGPFCLCCSRSRWLRERLVPQGARWATAVALESQQPHGAPSPGEPSAGILHPWCRFVEKAPAPPLTPLWTTFRLSQPWPHAAFFFFFPAFSYAVKYA